MLAAARLRTFRRPGAIVQIAVGRFLKLVRPGPHPAKREHHPVRCAPPGSLDVSTGWRTSGRTEGVDRSGRHRHDRFRSSAHRRSSDRRGCRWIVPRQPTIGCPRCRLWPVGSYAGSATGSNSGSWACYAPIVLRRGNTPALGLRRPSSVFRSAAAGRASRRRGWP